jgi:hypothetical protein
MKPETALKLKEAGFPQEGEGKSMIVISEGNSLDPLTREDIEKHPPCYYPTLSELIEACGDQFFQLKRCQSNQWQVEARGEWGTCGSTPSEAVAALWLALQEKKKPLVIRSGTAPTEAAEGDVY